MRLAAVAKALKRRNPMTVKKSTEKRVSRYRASAEKHKKFEELFGPELVITIPGLSGAIIFRPSDTKEGEDK